ncbi:hypothetical protein KSF78_0007090, partial [Schistosoma japonicum]
FLFYSKHEYINSRKRFFDKFPLLIIYKWYEYIIIDYPKLFKEYLIQMTDSINKPYCTISYHVLFHIKLQTKFNM